MYKLNWAAQSQNETFITTTYEYGQFSQVEVTKTWFFTQKFQLRCLAIHAHTVETGCQGWCLHNVITAQVKIEGIIQIDCKFQGDKFWRFLASELSFIGSIAYFDKHSVWIKVCEITYNLYVDHKTIIWKLLACTTKWANLDFVLAKWTKWDFVFDGNYCVVIKLWHFLKSSIGACANYLCAFFFFFYTKFQTKIMNFHERKNYDIMSLVINHIKLKIFILRQKNVFYWIIIKIQY